MNSETQSAEQGNEPLALTVEQTVWLQAWCAVANAFNSDSDAAKRWADKCLAQFKEKFPCQS